MNEPAQQHHPKHGGEHKLDRRHQYAALNELTETRDEEAAERSDDVACRTLSCHARISDGSPPRTSEQRLSGQIISTSRRGPARDLMDRMSAIKTDRGDRGKTMVVCALCQEVMRYITPPVRSNRRVYGICPNCATRYPEPIRLTPQKAA